MQFEDLNLSWILDPASLGPPNWSHFRSWDLKSFRATPRTHYRNWSWLVGGKLEWLQRLVKHTFGKDEIHWVHCFRCESEARRNGILQHARGKYVCLYSTMCVFDVPKKQQWVCFRSQRIGTHKNWNSFCLLCIQSIFRAFCDEAVYNILVVMGIFISRAAHLGWQESFECLMLKGWSIANLQI